MKVPDTSDNLAMCICPECSTYKKCKLKNGLFCAKKAKETIKKEGCNCTKCAIYQKNALKGEYFCRKPTKLLWYILGLAIIVITVAVVVWILLSSASPATIIPPDELSTVTPNTTSPPISTVTPSPTSIDIPKQLPSPTPGLELNPTAPPLV